jgi:hypothetical protein
MGGQYTIVQYQSLPPQVMRIRMDSWITDPHLERVVLLGSPILFRLVGTKSSAGTERMGEEMYLLESAIPDNWNSFESISMRHRRSQLQCSGSRQRQCNLNSKPPQLEKTRPLLKEEFVSIPAFVIDTGASYWVC